jgi:hypothetical protein
MKLRFIITQMQRRIKTAWVDVPHNKSFASNGQPKRTNRTFNLFTASVIKQAETTKMQMGSYTPSTYSENCTEEDYVC